MAEDYYQILGVSRSASQAEIQTAYRNLARKHHPDMNPDDKTAKKKFQKIQAAFDVLNDPQKREMYDRYGSSFETMGAGGFRGAAGREAGPGGAAWTTFGGPGVEDVDFSQFFGERFGTDPGAGFASVFDQFQRGAGSRKRPRQRGRKGADAAHEISIPFVTAAQGGEIQLAVARSSGPPETLSVKMPPGIEDGKKLRLGGQGEPGIGGAPAGDLLLTVHVQPHPFFQRRGNNLQLRVPLTLGEAAAGATIDIPTPKGTVALHIPPGSSSGTKLRVKGHGITPRSGSAGDLIVEVEIVLPKDLDQASRDLLVQIDRRHPQDPRAGLRW